MSYDLVIFDNKNVPVRHDAFMEWFNKAKESIQDTNENQLPYAMQSLYEELIESFPNGSDVQYYFGTDIIFASFDYVQSEKAHSTLKLLAKKYRVGFYNASSARFELDVN